MAYWHYSRCWVPAWRGFSLEGAGWLLKLLPLTAAIVALGYFHALPLLDREMEQLTRDLNDVLRKRVEHSIGAP